MRSLKKTSLALALLACSACSYLDMSTAAQLNALNPLEADPADFSVYLDVPEAVGIPSGSARLGFEGTRSDTGESLSGEFTLHELPLPDGTRVYRIADADLAPMRTLQANMKKWKEEAGRKASGSISFWLQACLASETLDPDAPINVDLTLQKDGQRMPLITGLPISKFLERTESGNFLPCTDL